MGLRKLKDTFTNPYGNIKNKRKGTKKSSSLTLSLKGKHNYKNLDKGIYYSKNSLRNSVLRNEVKNYLKS